MCMEFASRKKEGRRKVNNTVKNIKSSSSGDASYSSNSLGDRCTTHKVISKGISVLLKSQN